MCMSWDNIKILHNTKAVRRSKQCQCAAVERSTCSTGRSWQCPSCGCAHHTTECVSCSSGVMWNCVQSTFCPGMSSATIAIDPFSLPGNCTRSDSNVKIIKQNYTVIKTKSSNSSSQSFLSPLQLAGFLFPPRLSKYQRPWYLLDTNFYCCKPMFSSFSFAAHFRL